MLACCGADSHPWDRYQVETVWLPRKLSCLIVGENPGGNESEYFYAVPESYTRDRVVVRRCLLRGLHDQKLIPEATLEGFRDAGLLFDHAIRCPLPSTVVKEEHRAARRYASTRLENPTHLCPWLSQATAVWVMGHLASNAVANATAEFPKQRRRISMHPYPGEISPRSKFFLSEYFTWRNEKKTPEICQAFIRFARERAIFDDVA